MESRDRWRQIGSSMHGRRFAAGLHSIFFLFGEMVTEKGFRLALYYKAHVQANNPQRFKHTHTHIKVSHTQDPEGLMLSAQLNKP